MPLKLINQSVYPTFGGKSYSFVVGIFSCKEMDPFIGNEHGDASSNPGRDFLHFSFLHIYIYIFTYPPLEQDATQGQF